MKRAVEELIEKFSCSPCYYTVLCVTHSSEKIAQQGRSLGRQDRLGMELDSLDIELPMPHAHDQAFVVGRRYFEAFRQGGAIDDQGMVAACSKGLGQMGV